MKKIISWLLILTLLTFTPTVVTNAKPANTRVKYNTITSPKDLDEIVEEGAKYSSNPMVGRIGDVSPTYLVEVDEPGWLMIKSTDSSTLGKYKGIKLYSNAALTKEIAKDSIQYDSDNALTVYVKPGKYYYNIYAWGGHNSNSQSLSQITSYIGFLPASSRISVNKVKLSKDKSRAEVTFKYDKSYFTGFKEKSTIRVESGTVPVSKYNDNKKWKTNTIDNVLSKNLFYVTKNGKYTARIAGEDDDLYCLATFEVKGLKTGKPKAPKINNMKSKAAKVTGTGIAGTTVYLKSAGKTYKSTVNNKGKWSLKVNSLKKDAKVTAYVKNLAGKSSVSVSKKVK